MLNRQLAKSVFVLYDCDCLISLLVLFIPISRYTAYHMFLDYFHGFQSIFGVAPCQHNMAGGVQNHTQNLHGSNH